MSAALDHAEDRSLYLWVEFGLRSLQQDGDDVHLDEIVGKCDDS